MEEIEVDNVVYRYLNEEAQARGCAMEDLLETLTEQYSIPGVEI